MSQDISPIQQPANVQHQNVIIPPTVPVVVSPAVHPDPTDPFELGRALFYRIHQNREEELKEFKKLSLEKMMM